MLCFISSYFLFSQEVFSYLREEFEQQPLLLVGRELHTAGLGQFGIGLHLVFRGVVRRLLTHAGDFQPEFGVDRNGGLAVFALDEPHELRTLGRIHRPAGLLVHRAGDGLSTDDLRRGGYQRR